MSGVLVCIGRIEPAGLLNHVGAHIRLEGLGDADAFGRLVVLQQGGHDARQGQCRAVQRVAKLGLLLRRAVAALQAVGLIGVVI